MKSLSFFDFISWKVMRNKDKKLSYSTLLLLIFNFEACAFPKTSRKSNMAFACWTVVMKFWEELAGGENTELFLWYAQIWGKLVLCEQFLFWWLIPNRRHIFIGKNTNGFFTNLLGWGPLKTSLKALEELLILNSRTSPGKLIIPDISSNSRAKFQVPVEEANLFGVGEVLRNEQKIAKDEEKKDYIQMEKVKEEKFVGSLSIFRDLLQFYSSVWNWKWKIVKKTSTRNLWPEKNHCNTGKSIEPIICELPKSDMFILSVLAFGSV